MKYYLLFIFCHWINLYLDVHVYADMRTCTSILTFIFRCRIQSKSIKWSLQLQGACLIRIRSSIAYEPVNQIVNKIRISILKMQHACCDYYNDSTFSFKRRNFTSLNCTINYSTKNTSPNTKKNIGTRQKG